jgi:hypothetical protein
MTLHRHGDYGTCADSCTASWYNHETAYRCAKPARPFSLQAFSPATAKYAFFHQHGL